MAIAQSFYLSCVAIACFYCFAKTPALALGYFFSYLVQALVTCDRNDHSDWGDDWLRVRMAALSWAIRVTMFLQMAKISEASGESIGEILGFCAIDTIMGIICALVE